VIEYEILPDNGVVIVTPVSPLEKADFVKLAQAVDPLIESQGRLNGLMIYVEDFPGWEDFGALVSHMKFVKDHHRHIQNLQNSNILLCVLCVSAVNFTFYSPQRRGERREKDFCKRLIRLFRKNLARH